MKANPLFYLLLSAIFSIQTVTAEESAVDAVEEVSSAETSTESDEWNVAAPPLPTREIPIKVSEGTWMSLDVSPDGKTIAFDMLGDIYTLPIEGGEATNISAGLPWEIQPRFSPDGAQLAFISDRAGGDRPLPGSP